MNRPDEISPSRTMDLTVPPPRRGGLPSRPSLIDAMDPELLDDSDSAGYLEYWRILCRRKGTITLAAILGTLVGLLVSLPQTPIYQSRAVLEIQGLNERFLNLGEVNPTTSAAEGSAGDIGTHVRILQSREVIERVVERLQLEERPEFVYGRDRFSAWRTALGLPLPEPVDATEEAIRRAASSLQVQAFGNTRIVEIICESTDPGVAADFANALTEEYVQRTLEARWEATQRTERWLSQQLEELRIKLEKSEQRLQQYARETGLSFTADNESAAQERLRQLQTEWSNAQAERIAKQSLYELAGRTPSKALPELLEAGSFQQDMRTLTGLQRELERLERRFTGEHPKVQALHQQIEDLKGTVGRERAIALQRVDKEYQAAQHREQLLEDLYATQARLVSEEAEKSIQYNILKGEIETTRQIHDHLLQKVKEAGVASALSANNVRLVDAARPPASPYRPDHVMNSAFGLLAGVLLGVVFAFVRETADRSLRQPGEAPEHLHVPELGVIPASDVYQAAAARKKRRLVLRRPRRGGPTTLSIQKTPAESPPPGEEPEHAADRLQRDTFVAESFRATLTSILLSGRNGDRPKLLVVTSPGPGEGKTTVATHLALSLAEINHRVLLIDADLRRPRVHEVFGIANKTGLATLLQAGQAINGDFSFDSVVARTTNSNLAVIPAGPCRRKTPTILHSPRMQELLHHARRQFDTVLIDTPPMMQISDARVLGEMADAVILVLRAGQTSRETAKAAKERFLEDGTPVLGTVLNGWDPKLTGYGYYDSYHYRSYYDRYHPDNLPSDEEDGSGASRA